MVTDFQLCFRVYHKKGSGNSGWLENNDISKVYPCSYVHTNNYEQSSFVINELCYQEDCIFGCADMQFSAYT
jgi:hypothetical protein